MTLVEFLLARIGEQEAAARGQIELRAARYPGEDFDSGGETFWVDRGPWMYADPVRVLARCEADRRIVTEVHHRAADGPRAEYLSKWQEDACEGCGWGGPCDDYHVEHVDQCPTLRLLALPYADHHDYDPSWRP